jgi:SRSO17 transposase
MFHAETTKDRLMSLQDIAALGKMLAQFLALFADCFQRKEGRVLLAVYVRGLLSSLQRKNVEAIALAQGTPPRTLQRFLESIAWAEELLRDGCQRLIAKECPSADAIGCVDETGTAKSGPATCGVKRQYNGHRGKVENCVNAVALSYSTDDFHCLLDARLYLPEDWANDPVRRKKVTCRTKSSFAPSPSSRCN